MLVSKGDNVQLECGAEGEVIETWGYNRLFVRIRTTNGRIIPAMGSEVVSKLNRIPTWGGGSRSRSQKTQGRSKGGW